MGILIACLTTGKGTWKTVTDIINSTDWKKIYLITNEFGKENYKHTKEINHVIINLSDNVEIMRDKIITGLKDIQKEIGFNDVAINFSSGTGKEHSAMLSAIIKLGCGIRIIDIKDNKLITI